MQVCITAGKETFGSISSRHPRHLSLVESLSMGAVHFLLFSSAPTLNKSTISHGWGLQKYEKAHECGDR